MRAIRNIETGVVLAYNDLLAQHPLSEVIEWRSELAPPVSTREPMAPMKTPIEGTLPALPLVTGFDPTAMTEG